MPRMDSTIAALSKLPSSKVSVPVSRLDILLCPFDLNGSGLFKELFEEEYPDAPEEVRECVGFEEDFATGTGTVTSISLEILSAWIIATGSNPFPLAMIGSIKPEMSRIELSQRTDDFS